MAGAAFALSMYLKDNPHERISSSDAAICGGMTGIIAGAVAGIGGLLTGVISGTLLVKLFPSLPPDVYRSLGWQTGMGVLGIPANALIYGMFGALGGFLSLTVFFQDRALR